MDIILVEKEPLCNVLGECICPEGYQLDVLEEKEICTLEDSDDDDTGNDVQCNMDNRCSAYASCTWNGLSSRYECVCNPGYHGDGTDCREKDLSCVDVRREDSSFK